MRYHPDGGLQVGDQVSIEIFSTAPIAPAQAQIRVEVLLPHPQELGTATLQPIGSGRFSGSLLWAWSTRDLSPGDYTLQYTLLPNGPTWQEAVHLSAPPAGPAPTWLEKETSCCRLHVISGTQAARDIEMLAQMVEDRAEAAAGWLGYDLTRNQSGSDQQAKIDIDFIPRLLGQGGFTGAEIIVTYSDENYASSDFGIILQHELIHRIDGLSGGDLRPLILVEGLAVYLTGGHYKVEPIAPSAKYLLTNGGYLPLKVLSEDFYSHQHENGYLEAAAFVAYLVGNYGWPDFLSFYRDIHPIKDGKDSDAINQALQKHFQMTLDDMERGFTDWLAELPGLPDLREDSDVVADYYDLIRDYQNKYDPSANFTQVWLPDPSEMRKRGIVADYLRSPDGGVDQQIEAQLSLAGQDWLAGRYPEAWAELGTAHRLIDADP